MRFAKIGASIIGTSVFLTRKFRNFILHKIELRNFLTQKLYGLNTTNYELKELIKLHTFIQYPTLANFCERSTAFFLSLNHKRLKSSFILCALCVYLDSRTVHASRIGNYYFYKKPKNVKFIRTISISLQFQYSFDSFSFQTVQTLRSASQFPFFVNLYSKSIELHNWTEPGAHIEIEGNNAWEQKRQRIFHNFIYLMVIAYSR